MKSFYRTIMARATPATPAIPATELFAEMAPFLLLESPVGEAPAVEEPVEVVEPPALGVEDGSGKAEPRGLISKKSDSA